MLAVAVCDDSAADRERLCAHIKKNIKPGEAAVWEFDSGVGLLGAMEKTRFAVIFLDIQMAGLNGNETAKEIRRIDENLVLVFYTGFVEPSPFCFEVQPYRYIMKTMTGSQIDAYVRDALLKMRENSKLPYLSVHVGKRLLFIGAQHIIYIEKYKKSTRVHLTKAAYRIYGIEPDENGLLPDVRFQGKLREAYDKLWQYGFGWPHDSYIINFRYLTACTAKTLQLAETSATFQIARSKAKAFHELKNNFICSKYVSGIREV